MEGLEISEILLSNLEFSKRIDSEYYKPIYLKYETLIQNNQSNSLGKLSKFLIGPFGSSFDTNNYVENGEYRYVRGQDVKPFVLKDGENRYVPEKDFLRLIKYSLKEKDILVSVVGTLGNACIVQQKDIPAIFSCKSTVIRTEQINPVYTLTYLNCKYGKELLLRKERGAIQKGLNLDDLKSTIIPIYSDEFQEKINSIFYFAQDKISLSKSIYKQAEKLLLESAYLINFQPRTEKVNIKNFKDSFLTTGRLDAEYYQMKYEDYKKLIRSYKNGCGILQGLCHLKDENYNPLDNDTYSYIELADIGKTGDITSSTKAYGNELPTRARRKVKTGDVIISSIEGSLESCALITPEYDEALCSTGFYVINSEIMNSETLLVLFKSELMQNIMKQACSGTILTAMNRDEFLNIPVPLIETKIQKEIKEFITESFRLKKESENLLEAAKRAVEIAIEEGEGKALEMIDEKILK